MVSPVNAVENVEMHRAFTRTALLLVLELVLLQVPPRQSTRHDW